MTFKELITKKDYFFYEMINYTKTCVSKEKCLELMQLVREKTIEECVEIAKKSLYITQTDEPALGMAFIEKMDKNSIIL